MIHPCDRQRERERENKNKKKKKKKKKKERKKKERESVSDGVYSTDALLEITVENTKMFPREKTSFR